MNKITRLFAIFMVALLFAVPSVHAQKKNLTMEDAVVGMWREYYPEYRRNIQFRPDNKNFTYIDGTELKQGNIKSGKEKVILTFEELNAAMETAGLEKPAYFPSIKWETANKISFNNGNSWVCFDISKKAVLKSMDIPDEAENLDIAPNNSATAYTVENNLNIKVGTKTIAVTNNSELGLVAGQTVARSEFGIEKGTFWSPNSNKLAYYLKDESMVSDYPLVNITTRVATVDNIKYPMAGMKSEETKLHVYDVETGKDTEIITEGDPEQFLTNIAWTPDEKYVLIAVLNRGQNHMHLNMYDSSNGKFVRTLFEETNDKYIEPQHPAMFIPGSTDQFIWQTNRGGYNHLYLYNTKGELIKQLTKGEWEITDIIGFTPDSKSLIIQTTKDSPIERHIYKLDIASTKLTKLTTATGTHSASISTDGKYILDNYSSTEVPNSYDIISTKGKQTLNILTAENPLKEINMGKMSINTIKAADGKTDLYYRLILPPDFDSTKTYPAIVYVYGGPHAQLISNTWMGGARGWQYYMAEQGYVMFTLDNRGSANRGLEFENVIHRQLGVNEMADQMKGIDFLYGLGYIDNNRIGVHGWSFGGFMTTNLMLNHSDVFKVGVAGGPVIDWKYYEVMYGERYMDTPQENPEGYENSFLAGKTTQLKGKLLMIHGGIDPTVVQQNSLVFIRECVKNQVPVDYYMYPRAEHNVRGYDRIHLMQKVTEYFIDYL